MKKQFHKIKIAAENLSRSNRNENKNDELGKVEKHVEKYKDVLEKIYKKFSPYAGSEQDKEKRVKKIHEYRLGQALEESSKELPGDLILHQVLNKCGELEKTIAGYIIENEIQTENEVTKKLKSILDTDIQEIASHKRAVARYLQEYNSIKKQYENMQRSNENSSKLNQLKFEQEEWESKLEKERDCWAAEMFELISKDEIIAYSIRDFVIAQKVFYEKALRNMDVFLNEINDIVQKCQKKRVFGVDLKEHLHSTNRDISFVIELCVCSLIERGLCEEGLLRVGCAGTKLKRMKNAIDAQYVSPPLPPEYQDVHVIGGILKLYLRELPEPLLTYNLYKSFIHAAQRSTEHERKTEILNAINQLPKENYNNLKYLTRFLWQLYQKQDQNKMSSQNIAIVMSPNILWPPDSQGGCTDYIDQVNSSAAVNTIVELLVSDWNYFFGGEVEFFINFTRDSLFVENGANNIGATENVQISTEAITPHRKQAHSRSSSHDTSQIFLNSLDNSSVGRSHSNDSLSENSSPTHGESPKLPARRKHNKPSAPNPPQKSAMPVEQNNTSKSVTSDELTSPATDAYQSNQLQTNSIGSNKCDNYSQTPPISTCTDKNANKPEKPPRPTFMDSYTLNRSTYKNHKANDKLQAIPKPVALPRTILNVAKSTENLTTLPDDGVHLRDKPEVKEKPAIPERPVTLMRPTSFRVDNQIEIDKPLDGANNTGTGLKKASSFRMSAITSPAQGNAFVSNKTASNSLTNSTGSLCSNSSASQNHKTTLERAQIYSVDKKQVAIIDVLSTDSNSGTPTMAGTTNSSTIPTTAEIPSTFADSAISSSREFISVESGNFPPLVGQVPPSPRGFDPRIKRPQVPAPPPPTNHRKSDSGLGDSTHL